MPLPDAPDSELWCRTHLVPHEPLLRAWLKSRFSPGAEIDDAIQEAYLRVMTARKNGPITAPKAYFFATARNLALKTLRAKIVRGEDVLVQMSDLDLLMDDTVDVAESIARNQELEMLTRAIQSLPERCRRIFTLRKIYGMAQRDIATQLGLSARTVNAQLTIAFDKCVKLLSKHREGDPRG